MSNDKKKNKNKKDVSVELLLLSFQSRNLIDRKPETVKFWRNVLNKVDDTESMLKTFS